MLALYFGLVIFILSLKILWSKRYRESSEPPYISGYIPLIGHSYRLIGNGENMFELVQELTEKAISGGDTVRIALGPKSCYVLADPNDIMTVATTCMQKSSFYEFSTSWLGDGLVSCMDDTKWKTHRKLLNHAFNQQTLDGLLPSFNNSARRMCNEFAIDGRNGPFIPDKLVTRCALETIYQATTGLKLRADKELKDKYIASMNDVFHTMVMRTQNIFYHNNFLWNRSSLKARHDKAIKFSHSLVSKAVEVRKQKTEEQTQEGTITETTSKSFSDLFFDIDNIQAKETFTEKDVLDHLNTLIASGYDTVAIIFMLVMLVIGTRSEVQDKMYAELQEVFDKTDRDVEKRDLSRLVYMEAVIKEVLRLYPPGPLVMRYIDKEVSLRNYTLKPGKICIMLINAINRHPKLWDDPEEFNPERWLNTDMLKRTPYLFSSFSFGKRNCIGKTYAMMWIKTYLSHVLRKYQVFGDINKVVFKYDVLTKISSGHYISVKRRT